MNALIIGAGAVGIGIAASLADRNVEVALLASEKTGGYIRKNGIKRTGIFKEITIPAGELTVYGDYSEISKAYDYVIISAKATSNCDIAQALKKNNHIVGDKIVIFQNGWGNNDEYLKYFSEDILYNARIITGFERTEAGISNVTVHTAPILLGSLYKKENQCMKPLADAINSSGLPSEVSEDIEKALWAKMLFNTTLNPLGAVLNVTYGKLTESEYTKKIMNSLIDETFLVMNAAGFETFWKNADEYRESFYNKLVPDTYMHRSSTLQDIERGYKTEIDTLNGCIVRLAARYNVNVPTHEMIVNLIKSIEEIK